MRDSDRRKLHHKTLEQLRIRAVGQVEHGAHRDEVAQARGMTRAAVYAWMAKYREGGLEALKARPRPRTTAEMSGHQLARLYGLGTPPWANRIATTPCRVGLWSCKAASA
jgi:transposase-like protein